MKLFTNPRIWVTAVLAALALAAAALASTAGEGLTDDGRLAVELRDGDVVPDRSLVAPGPRTLAITNAGSREHELVIVRTDLAPDELPLGLHGVSVDQSGELVFGEDHLALAHAHEPGEILGLLPGEDLTSALELSPGAYVLYCQTAGHYLDGEAIAITVE